MNKQFLRQNHYHTKYTQTVPIRIRADGLTSRGSSELPAFRDHRSGTTVEQYIFVKYRYSLDFSNIQCIFMREPNGHKHYYPIETLYICYDPDC
jgi:hypothetical protein